MRLAWRACCACRTRMRCVHVCSCMVLCGLPAARFFAMLACSRRLMQRPLHRRLAAESAGQATYPPEFR
ncbi:hypothetical protein XCCB100_4481 [Xanthomonas campestris pv. campestris]|uniref:Uncharacterized protein n=1 Tax=Xanthomonas campestris pv. campestris (strain B100) TaxID=509169 RepID=A0A1X7QG90_XANCB|nr:hypothetical protein XCCB100_4481 [Xanthomonas campestris pv. campestris]